MFGYLQYLRFMLSIISQNGARNQIENYPNPTPGSTLALIYPIGKLFCMGFFLIFFIF